MDDTRSQHQIIRKDARNCFVESLSDAFAFGKVHLGFATYDTKLPAGKRQTNSVHIYIAADEFLEPCRKLPSAKLHCGKNVDSLFVVSSGPGEINKTRLIVGRQARHIVINIEGKRVRFTVGKKQKHPAVGDAVILYLLPDTPIYEQGGISQVYRYE